MSRKDTAFTPSQRAYLNSLPAIKHATATRIYYTSQFHKDAVQQYDNGADRLLFLHRLECRPPSSGAKGLNAASTGGKTPTTHSPACQNKYTSKSAYSSTRWRAELRVLIEAKRYTLSTNSTERILTYE